VIHDKSIKNDKEPHSWSAEILPILSKAYNMVKDKFPHTLLIPCFGNNDAPYHYQTIKQDQKALIYGDIFNLWFKNHPVNSKIPNIENVRSTLMQGGYFRVDIGESLAVLNLNSLYMACRNNADLENEHL